MSSAEKSHTLSEADLKKQRLIPSHVTFQSRPVVIIYQSLTIQVIGINKIQVSKTVLLYKWEQASDPSAGRLIRHRNPEKTNWGGVLTLSQNL